MTGGETTIVAGIEIPSADPVFLAVVLGVHVPLGLACVVIGAIAMLSEKRRGRHSRFGTIYFWCLLALFGSATFLSLMRWDENYHLFILGALSLACGWFGLSAPASLALLGQASYRRDGAVVHSDAGCFLRRQWKAASALEGPASFHVLADTHGRRDTAHRSRASLAAVGASARRDFLTGRHPEYRAPCNPGRPHLSIARPFPPGWRQA